MNSKKFYTAPEIFLATFVFPWVSRNYGVHMYFLLITKLMKRTPQNNITSRHRKRNETTPKKQSVIERMSTRVSCHQSITKTTLNSLIMHEYSVNWLATHRDPKHKMWTTPQFSLPTAGSDCADLKHNAILANNFHSAALGTCTGERARCMWWYETWYTIRGQ
jgi:hypothetical protein